VAQLQNDQVAEVLVGQTQGLGVAKLVVVVGDERLDVGRRQALIPHPLVAAVLLLQAVVHLHLVRGGVEHQPVALEEGQVLADALKLEDLVREREAAALLGSLDLAASDARRLVEEGEEALVAGHLVVESAPVLPSLITVPGSRAEDAEVVGGAFHVLLFIMMRDRVSTARPAIGASSVWARRMSR